MSLMDKKICDILFNKGLAAKDRKKMRDTSHIKSVCNQNQGSVPIFLYIPIFYIFTDMRVEAVMMRGDCGATTAYTYRIFIVPMGGQVGNQKPIFNADHLDGEIIQWREPRFLEIKYKQAKIYQFANFWHSRDVDNYRYVVEMRETALTDIHSLSPSDRWVEIEEREKSKNRGVKADS